MFFHNWHRKLGLHSLLGIVFLFLQVSADGLPGEYLITQRWRDMLAGHSCLHNPAFLTDEDYPTVRGVYSQILKGLFNLWEVGYTQPIGFYQSVGFSWLGEESSEIEKSSVDIYGNATDIGEKAKNQNNFFILSYAVNPINRLSVGANVNVAYQSLFGDPAAGVGIDLGLSYRLLRHPILGNHTIGFFFQNMLPPKLNTAEKSKYSANLKFSWLMNFLENRVETGVDLDVRDIYSQVKDFSVESGGAGNQSGDNIKTIEFDVNYRIGFNLLKVVKLYFQAGSNFWGLVGGINVQSLNDGRDLMFLYNFISLAQNDAGNSHSLYALMEIGKPRETIFARKTARLAVLMPNDVYNRACQLFSSGKYWDAFIVFGDIVSKYPDFFKIDWVEYYRARCLEEMDMRGQAITIYEETKKRYPRSAVAPMAALGIMRIDYRNENYSGIERQFSALNTKNVPDSLKFHAYYLLGETNLKQKELKKARQVFNLIPENHPEYAFAQHSLTVAYILNSRLNEAVICLENSVRAEAKTAAQKEIANRSSLFLGHIFYEKNLLSKAVSSLRMVPKSSYYYPDALLGLGWTALKARQWADCVNAGKELAKISDNPELTCEANLVESYGHLMQKNYQEAANVLKNATEILPTIEPPSKADLDARRRLYEENRTSYDKISKEVTNISATFQSSAVQRIIDSLYNEHERISKKLKEYVLFTDKLKRREIFARSFDKLREDIEYANAVAMKLYYKIDEVKLREKTIEKKEVIDKEIEKLQKEIEEIE